MPKRSTRSLKLAALLAASASAQTITSTIPVCPTASSTTITLPTTVTFCPGPHCMGGGPSGPMITNGPGMPGVHLGEFTSVGPDGKTTVMGIYETVYDSLCETGLVPATWTVTHECPCTAAPAPTMVPEGFETTVVPCSVCGPHSTVTLTQPCPTGPYATQTPTVGQDTNNAMAAPAGMAPAAAASAGSSAAAQAGSGSASAGAGSSAGASSQGPNAAAQAGSGSGASAQSPNGASAQAGSGSGAAAGINGASAQAGSGASAQANGANMVSPASASRPNTAPMNGTMPMSNNTRPAGAAPAVQSYVSAATSSATFALFTILSVVMSVLLL